MLRALAGQKTSAERRVEADQMQSFVGDLPLDVEQEMQGEIQGMHGRIAEERRRSERASERGP